MFPPGPTNEHDDGNEALKYVFSDVEALSSLNGDLFLDNEDENKFT